MSTDYKQINRLIDELHSLLDDESVSLAPILRKAARIATMVGDEEHRDLFLLHLNGITKKESAGPKYAPWSNPQWNPKWDVREVLMEDRTRSSDDKIVAFSIEEFEHYLKSFRQEMLRAQEKGDSKSALTCYELISDAEPIMFRIRKRVDTFLQIAESWIHARIQEQSSAIANTQMGSAIFIGHGRSIVWRDLKDFLSERLGLPYIEFNSESVAGRTTIDRLNEMLSVSCFAFLIMTAEDQYVDSSLHARENVIHEVGLFQGRLGFNRAIVLLEEGCTEFSNIHGLSQIRFPPNSVMSKSEEIRRVLEREGIIRVEPPSVP